MTASELETVPSVAVGAHQGVREIVVMQFGAMSVSDPERIKRVAELLVAARDRGARVIGVIGAMGQTTDQLLDLAGQVSPRPDARELDMLLSVGQRISCALVAMAVRDLGREAISLTGSQAGIITDTVHGQARIVEVRPRRVRKALDHDCIVLVAGVQGMSASRDITTLGEGGADTSAVALAASLDASACELYTDAGAVFTADPGLVPNARKLGVVTYEEMLARAAVGAGALQLRSVEFARNHAVRLHVRSIFAGEPGSWIVEGDESVERAVVSGVAQSLEETVYRVQGPGPSELFTALADGGVNVDTIIQTGADVIVFTARADDRGATAGVLDRLGATWSERDDLAKLSVVGSGMKSHPGVAARVFQTLDDLGIEAHFVSTSPFGITLYVSHGDLERAVCGLHDAFELGATDEGEDA